MSTNTVIKCRKVTVYTIDSGAFTFYSAIVISSKKTNTVTIKEEYTHATFNFSHVVCIQIEDPEEVKDEEV